jgi:hypothetical protein
MQKIFTSRKNQSSFFLLLTASVLWSQSALEITSSLTFGELPLTFYYGISGRECNINGRNVILSICTGDLFENLRPTNTRGPGARSNDTSRPAYCCEVELISSAMHSIDEILQSHSIGDLRQLIGELSQEAGSKQSELQLMVSHSP